MIHVGQLSLFSAETQEPAIDDLAGLLAGPGQSMHSAMGARISVVVPDLWRAEAICADILLTGIDAECVWSDENSPPARAESNFVRARTESDFALARGEANLALARTEANPRLTVLHRAWSAGAVKAVPDGWSPSARALRLWVLAAGHRDGLHYVLGLDPHAPDTHAPLATSLMRVGIAPTLISHRGHPALRITGRKRIGRLLENIGAPPPGADEWPDWSVR